LQREKGNAVTRWRTPAVMLAAAATVLSIALGIRHGFGLFLQPMSLEFGWGREIFALAIALQNLVWGAAQPVTGMLADRFGAARTMVGGTVLYVAGLVLMSVSSTPGALLLSVGVVLGLGLSGTTFAVVLGAVSRVVPPERRSRAMGIATAIGSFGQFVMLPGSLSLIGWLGWSAALIVLAGDAAEIPAQRPAPARREPFGERRDDAAEREQHARPLPGLQPLARHERG
jgi:MFS family permease